MGAATSTTNSWVKIRQGVKDSQQLIDQKQYNLSMVKARQTTELMVNCLAEKACLIDSELNILIDELYRGKWISKTTCDHYHKIRMLGNKAVHEGHDNAYDANQAYHLLSQEVYTFANEYNKKKTRPSSARSRRQTSKNHFSITANDLIRILTVVLCIIVVIAIFHFFTGKKDSAETESTSTPSVSTEVPTTTSETMAVTTPAPVYKTTSALNIRSAPSAQSDKLGQLVANTIVDYVGAHDDEWAIINFNGTKAYVSRQYLIHD